MDYFSLYPEVIQLGTTINHQCFQVYVCQTRHPCDSRSGVTMVPNSPPEDLQTLQRATGSATPLLPIPASNRQAERAMQTIKYM